MTVSRLLMLFSSCRLTHNGLSIVRKQVSCEKLRLPEGTTMASRTGMLRAVLRPRGRRFALCLSENVRALFEVSCEREFRTDCSVDVCAADELGPSFLFRRWCSIACFRILFLSSSAGIGSVSLTLMNSYFGPDRSTAGAGRAGRRTSSLRGRPRRRFGTGSSSGGSAIMCLFGILLAPVRRVLLSQAAYVAERRSRQKLSV